MPESQQFYQNIFTCGNFANDTAQLMLRHKDLCFDKQLFFKSAEKLKTVTPEIIGTIEAIAPFTPRTIVGPDLPIEQSCQIYAKTRTVM